MAKKPHGRRPAPRRRSHLSVVDDQPDGIEDLDLFAGIRRALASGDPLSVIALVSSLVAATDERNRAFDPEAEQQVDLGGLVAAFMDTPIAETTAILKVIGPLNADPEVRASIAREVSRRRHPLPAWLDGLDKTRIHSQIFKLTEPLGDGDDYFLGIELDDGSDIVGVVYLDHNLGGAVKDAFFVTEQYESFLAKVSAVASEPGHELSRVDPAEARAVMEDGIRVGASFYPPLESDSWPASRPMLEWALRMLPEGATAPGLREWDDDEVEQLGRDFLASPFGEAGDDDDTQALLRDLLWFATSYLDCAPLRWSPAKVEILLTDWMPRKVIAPPGYLRRLPEVLRPFIGYAAAERGLDADLTATVLGAVDRFLPDYLALIQGGGGGGWRGSSGPWPPPCSAARASWRTSRPPWVGPNSSPPSTTKPSWMSSSTGNTSRWTSTTRLPRSWPWRSASCRRSSDPSI